MNITIREEADTHGTYIEHKMHINEGIDKIVYSLPEKKITITYTTRTGEDIVKVSNYVKHIIANEKW